MDTPALDQDGQGTPPALQLVSAWADFSKALAIYPETNARVRAQLEALLGHIERAHGARAPGHDPERGITVVFHDTTVHVDQESHEMPEGSSLLWLRDRLVHAGLAGVEFMEDGLTGESLVAFCKQLLANFLRKESGLTYDDLWPTSFPSIVLIDLRFEGQFGGPADEGPYRGGHRGTHVRSAETNHFLRSLLAHPKVSRRVESLGAVAAQEEGETKGATELLARILEDVPAEALRSRDALIAAVCRVIDAMAEPTAPMAGVRSDGSGEAGTGEFANLLYQVSRKHFARKGPGLERLKPDTRRAVEQTPGGGRKRDAAIGDDLDALVSEIERLPSELAYDFARGEAESAAEQVATLMHFLTHLESPHKLPGLYPVLAQLLQAPGPDELQVLHAHLTSEGDDPEATARAREAIVLFLLRSGHAYLLRTCGVLTPDFVLADPAERLPLLLAGVDIDADDQRAELDEICASIGPELLDLQDALAPALADLPREQAAAVLRRPSRARLPLVRVLLAVHPGRLVPEATAFLRSLDLPEDEAFLLFQLHDPSHITRTYLVALVDLHFQRLARGIVHSAIVDLLARHIRATHTPMPEHPERMESIRNLARYPSVNGMSVLQELQKTVFGPIGAKEPAAVRKLARTVAKQMLHLQEDLPIGHLLPDGPDDHGQRKAA